MHMVSRGDVQVDVPHGIASWISTLRRAGWSAVWNRRDENTIRFVTLLGTESADMRVQLSERLSCFHDHL